MIQKDLEKFQIIQKKSDNQLGFLANTMIKVEMRKIINQLKTCANFKKEELETKNGKFYKYSADVNDSLFPYKVEIFFAKLNKVTDNEFFRIEIL